MTAKKPKTTKSHWRNTLPADWTVKHRGEDGNETEIPLRDHPMLEKYGTKDEAVKALVHAQRMLGKTPQGFVQVPGEDDQEAAEAFYAAIGRPEGPDGYELPDLDLPEDFVLHEDMLEGLRAKAHELGLTPKQVAGLYSWFLPLNLDSHHRMKADAEEFRTSEVEALRSIHRTDLPGTLDRALRAAEILGGDELLAALDKTGAGDHAAVISAFAKIAPLVLEGGMKGTGSGYGEELTKERLMEMMRDPRYSDPTQRDQAYVRKIREGFNTLYPGKYVPGTPV